jgi:hypothetical protein
MIVRNIDHPRLNKCFGKKRNLFWHHKASLATALGTDIVFHSYRKRPCNLPLQFIIAVDLIFTDKQNQIMGQFLSFRQGNSDSITEIIDVDIGVTMMDVSCKKVSIEPVFIDSLDLIG